MKRDRIIEDLRAILESQLGRSVKVTWETNVQRDLELDSIRRLALVVEIENRFLICLDPDDDRDIETIGDLVRVIERQLSETSR